MKRLTMIATIALAMGGVVACGGKTETADNAVETEKIEKVVIPNGVKFIGKSAFDRCKKLKEINIPDSVTSIGSSAFYYCDSLENIP